MVKMELYFLNSSEYEFKGEDGQVVSGKSARFIELKHFETLYTGWILRAQKGIFTPSDMALAEVLQPNVEKYKKSSCLEDFFVIKCKCCDYALLAYMTSKISMIHVC